VQKGQTLYANFKLIEPISFFNSTKLVGDNPYIIEQNINDDFDFYASELEQIKKLLEANRDEYKVLRKAELKKQITSIQNAIEKIFAKEKELSSLLSTAKEKYSKFRQNEFSLQSENFNLITKESDMIFTEYKNNTDLINENKINGFTYKFLSAFSKNKKKTIADHSVLQNSFSKLEKHLSNTKDIKSVSFQGSLANKNATLQNVKSSLSEIKSIFNTKIETEFSGFNLNSILEVSSNHFQKIESEINSANTETQTILQSMKTVFSNYLSEIETLLQTLTKELSESKDIILNYTFERSFTDNKSVFPIIQSKIEEIQNEFDTKIQNEFQKISLLNKGTNGIDIKSLPILQEKVNNLVNKFNSDSWLKVQIKTTDFYSLLSELETHIKTKNDYFNSEQDLFLAEFKWFQFYNGLSENEKTIINELKPKTNWRKPFLIFYLDSLLRVSASGGELPVNDDEHIELDTTLNGIGKEQ